MSEFRTRYYEPEDGDTCEHNLWKTKMEKAAEGSRKRKVQRYEPCGNPSVIRYQILQDGVNINLRMCKSCLVDVTTQLISILRIV